MRYGVRMIVLVCFRPNSVDGYVFMGTFSFLCQFSCGLFKMNIYTVDVYLLPPSFFNAHIHNLPNVVDYIVL